MSRRSTFSSSLLHLLLLLSLAVCSRISEARPIAGVPEKQDERTAPGKSQISSKDVEKSIVQARVSASSSRAKPSNNQNEPEAVGKMDGTQPLKHELKDDRKSHRAKQVSWKLPHPKAPNGDERQPGSFNQLDYDPPRTHPPSHN